MIINELVFMDIDDTLFKTDAKIIIKNNKDEIVKELTTEEYGNYSLNPEDIPDFSQFRDGKLFKELCVPLTHNIELTRHMIQTGEYVVLLTARERFTNNPEDFYQVLIQHGIFEHDIEFAGELYHIIPDGNSRKCAIIYSYLKQYFPDKISVYDDSLVNIEAFIRFKKSMKQGCFGEGFKNVEMNIFQTFSDKLPELISKS